MDFLANLEITQKILRRIAEIDEFKGQWQALGRLAPDRLSALKKIATIESIGSSTRIEGVRLTDAEIERLLTGIQVFSFRSRDEQEVAGYAELMEMVFSSWSEIALTENHIKQFHGILLKHSDKDERHRGNYKTLPNHVEAFDENGKSLGVIFETASPFDTPRKMEALIAWTNEEMNKNTHHPLLIIAAFVVRFLAIHPFQDGNGRLSRALTTLLLLRSGYQNETPASVLDYWHAAMFALGFVRLCFGLYRLATFGCLFNEIFTVNCHVSPLLDVCKNNILILCFRTVV